MKFLLIALTLVGCIEQTGSEVQGTDTDNPIALLFTGQSLDNLQNWTDTEKVSDADVKETKQEIMTALRLIGFNTLPELEHDQIRVGFSQQREVISVYSLHSHCIDEGRKSCFHLEIMPASNNTYEVKVVRLPAYERLAEITGAYSEEEGAKLLAALLEVLPHDLVQDQIGIETYGAGDNSVLVLTTTETPQRELHIESSDGSIDNSKNAKHGYQVYQDEMRGTGQMEEAQSDSKLEK